MVFPSPVLITNVKTFSGLPFLVHPVRCSSFVFIDTSSFSLFFLLFCFSLGRSFPLNCGATYQVQLATPSCNLHVHTWFSLIRMTGSLQWDVNSSERSCVQGVIQELAVLSKNVDIQTLQIKVELASTYCKIYKCKITDNITSIRS